MRCHPSPYRNPSTSGMSNTPGLARARFSATNSAARSAPATKSLRDVARCVISMRSPVAREEHRVLAHDVASAQRREADGARLALAR